MKFRRKPTVVVEAFQWKGGDFDRGPLPEWLGDAFAKGTARIEIIDGKGNIVVQSSFGRSYAEVGDWIVKDGDEMKVYAHNSFEATYERVDEELK